MSGFVYHSTVFRGNRGKLAASLLLLVASILSTAGVLEAVLRATTPLRYSRSILPPVYVRDEQLGYRYAPGSSGRLCRNFEIDNLVRINSLGFHDIEHSRQSSETDPRILVIGDSFTAALHVGVSDGWTQTLQRGLRSVGHRSAEVVNLGLDGTGTDVHLAILKEYLPVFEPDLVILAFYENDADDVMRKRRFRECYGDYVLVFENDVQRDELRAFVEEHRPGSALAWLIDHSLLARAMTFWHAGSLLLKTNFISPSMIGMPVEQETYETADIDAPFEGLLALSETHGFRLAVVPVPAREDPSTSVDALHGSLSSTLLDRLEVVDILPGVQRLLGEDERTYRDLFWRYDGHLDGYGNRVFGTAMVEVVDGLLGGERPDRP